MKWQLNKNIAVEFYATYSPDHVGHVRQYLYGYLKALEDFGIWRNGERSIGAKNLPLHIAFALGAYDLDEVKTIFHNGKKISILTD